MGVKVPRARAVAGLDRLDLGLGPSRLPGFPEVLHPLERAVAAHCHARDDLVPQFRIEP